MMVETLTSLQFLLLPILLFCGSNAWSEQSTSIDTIQYLCEHHSSAQTATFKVAKNQHRETYSCVLEFNVKVDKRDSRDLCEYMLPAFVSTVNHTEYLVTCEYEILYLCPPGQIPIHDVCLEFHDVEKTFDVASSECKNKNGRLPDTMGEGLRFLRHLIVSANPRKFGFLGRFYWYSGSENLLLVMSRGMDGRLPGHMFVGRKTSRKARYFCIREPMRSPLIYEKKCDILKQAFKLTTKFDGGTCYMLSTSIHSTELVQNLPHPLKLHDKCKWFTTNDGAVTPMSVTRMDAMDSLIKGTRYESLYVMTTASKHPKKSFSEFENWNTVNVDGSSTPITKGSHQWLRTRPILMDGDAPNSQAVMMPKEIRQMASLLDVPLFFRGHLTCATGVTIRDIQFKTCDSGWNSVLRDDSRIMCIKGFKTELFEKDNHYATNFCGKFGAVLAPVESADEQQILLDIVKKLNTEKGAMWLGARRKSDGNFYWDLDGRMVTTGKAGGTNWNEGEPNNVRGRENCLQFYTHRNNLWNDIECSMTKGSSRQAHDNIVGGVCAKYLID